MVFYEEGRGIFKITAFLKYNSYDPLRDIDFFFFKEYTQVYEPLKKITKLMNSSTTQKTFTQAVCTTHPKSRLEFPAVTNGLEIDILGKVSQTEELLCGIPYSRI